MLITRATIADAFRGGGIANAGTIRLVDVTVSGNGATPSFCTGHPTQTHALRSGSWDSGK